jgi:tetratricopeptide (TPR) repeat protein
VVQLYLAILLSLRGDPTAAPMETAGLAALRDNEDPQFRAGLALLDAIQAAAAGQLADALRHLRALLEHVPAIGVSTEFAILGWPFAVRVGQQLGDLAFVGEVWAMLDAYPVGHVPPLLRAERKLAEARRRAADGAPDADAALEAAVAELRAFASPYNLGQALLDRAEYLTAIGSLDEAELLRDEARDIADRLGAVSLRERADADAGAGAGAGAQRTAPPGLSLPGGMAGAGSR